MEENIVDNNASKPKKMKKRKLGKRSKDSEGWINSLPWNDANPADCSTVLLGSNEGGFISLEEIDEDAYNLERIQSVGTLKDHRESKKRKRAVEMDEKEQANESNHTLEDDLTQGLGLADTAVSSREEEEKTKKKRRKKKKKKKMKRKRKKSESKTNEDAHDHPEDGRVVDMTDMDIPNALEDASVKDHEDDLSFDVEEISEWKELRLHPLLEKAIRSLRFKEPTPIQKMCIPAAAHQGKDVIGAAETGSGKTLAFGIPILQRLLEEQDKEARKDGLTSKEERLSEGKKGSPLRALVITPTRELALQVCDHLKAAAKFTNIGVVPIVGGMAMQKQERFLKQKPQIVVGTPGRLWELMAGGERHLLELYSLSFFVLDEADRMIEKGHFHELRSIIDMLPAVQTPSSKSESSMQPLESDLRANFIQENVSKDNEVNSNSQRKRRQTFIFSATIALTAGFRKKLKRGSHGLKAGTMNGNYSLAILSERAGVRENAAIVDLTSASIVAHKLEESVIECREQDKDAYLYYILKVHGCGRTIVFCTSIAALRRVSAILRILKVAVWPLHAQMQQRSRLKAMDRFRGNENCVLVATDVAARGLDIPGVRTIIHYQLPHSAEVYVHRSGRTARAYSDGCSIALISPSDKSKFISLCNAFSKEGLPQFPVNGSYMPEVEKRVSIAIQVDRVSRKNSQTKAEKSWLTRNAEILEMDLEENESDKEEMRTSKPNKAELFQVKQLQQELDQLLQQPLQPKSLSHRFVAAAGMSTLVQQQLQEFTSAKRTDSEHRMPIGSKKQRFLVIGEETIEPLAALRNSIK